jgi:hypothetical protein
MPILVPIPVRICPRPSSVARRPAGADDRRWARGCDAEEGQVTSRSRGGWDPMALGAAVVAVLMAGLYLGLVAGQDGDPAPWFLAGLLLAAVAGAYGAARAAPRRRAALLACGALLVVLGALAILSIGLPILVAGVLALVAAARARPAANGGAAG